MEILQGMDFASATLAGFAVIGTVNVITMFKPDMDSRLKFSLAVLVAFIIGFVPAQLASELATRISDAIQLALASSGVYKVFK